MKKDRIFTVLLVGLVAVFVLAFVFLPMAGQSSNWYIVNSGSMEPALHVGDVVYVAGKDADDIEGGDIISFRQQDITITHRCVDIVQKGNQTIFQTKGDANEENDSFTVTAEQLIGKVPATRLFGRTVYAKAPRLGYLSEFVRTRLGFFLLVMIPGYSLIGMEAYNIFNVLQGMPYKKNGYTLYRSQRGHYFFAKKSEKGSAVPLPEGYKVVISRKTGFPFLKRANGQGELEMSMCLDCHGVFYYEKINGVNQVTCPFCSETWQEILKGPDNT